MTGGDPEPASEYRAIACREPFDGTVCDIEPPSNGAGSVQGARMLESDSATPIRDALDRAIADVARAEYARLAEGMDLGEQRLHVNDALESLKDLGRGGKPHYGEWTALFYLTWYQPRHIHLAYTVLRQQISKQRTPSQVIDFGCGAWAVQIALAILTCEKPALQDLIVHGIDCSRPMRQMGERLWRELRDLVGDNAQDPICRLLRETLDTLTDSCTCHASYDALVSDGAVGPSTSDDCWFTAFHVVYPSNQRELETVFQRIRRDWTPVLELLTTDDRKREHATFFGGSDLTIEQTPWGPEQLELTTQWRRTLRRHLGVEGTADLIDNYLSKPVRWNPWSNGIEGDTVMIRGGTL